MERVNPNRVGLSAAAVLAGWHVVWSLLVAFGVAPQVLEFAFALHGMKAEPVVVGPFNLMTASLLVLVTAIIGYVSGAAGALTWNCLNHWCASGAVRSQPAAGAAPSSPRHAA